MKDASEDEQEEDVPMPDSTDAKEKATANRKARSEREEQLRKMMDDEAEGSSPAKRSSLTSTNKRSR